MYNRLKKGASYYACGAFLNTLDGMRRAEVYTTLGYERLERKNRDINAIYEGCEQNWPQTFYIMMLRTLGGMDNKEAFTTLASRVRYAVITRERTKPKYIEAMLVGASGLLDLYEHDEYILNLKRDFVYLAAKYNIEPMRAKEWKLRNIYPNNHPILRLSQITTFLSQTPNIMDRILECKTAKDVNRLFSVETQPYWLTHYTPAHSSPQVHKRMGHTKTDLLGINLVAQMQFAYGSYISSEILRSRALSLLEDIPAEENSIIKQWNSYGRLARSAFDSQALLQLAFEYCRDKRCEECPVARKIIYHHEKKQKRATEAEQ
jgi:hypothetical protein